ncbi:MAG: phosphate ABC transporter permease PstA [Magnetococcus sp. WYHC-3]
MSEHTSFFKSERARALLRRRHASERLFRTVGLSGILVAAGALVLLLFTMISEGAGAFTQSSIRLDIQFDASVIDPSGARNRDDIMRANYAALIAQSLQKLFPQASSRQDKRLLKNLLSSGAPGQLQDMVVADPSLIGQAREVWFLASDDVDMLVKGHMERNTPEASRRLSDREIGWVDHLVESGNLERRFNHGFFTRGDSREPEMAGVLGALKGTFLTLMVTFLVSFPIGLTTAVYLEEFAPRNRWTDIIEVNINNLAAVPSIVYGLLGLAVFINVAHLPRSAPLVGGFTLALMTLPIIIIATRAALRAVPPSIRDAARGLGASPLQVVAHHVVPLAAPGILTGTIIGMAHALGETAPLLMIGMVAFIVDIPGTPIDAATVLPVQIFLWADSPERAFVEKTAAATLVLLAFLVVMNATAVYLRKRFERRW